jgi:hypothetical protein
MVSQYVANEFPDPDIRDRADPPSIPEIKRYVTVDELGWRPNQSDLTDLSTHITLPKFSLESWTGTPPVSLAELAHNNLTRDLPLIAFIDAQQLRQGVRGSGPLHSIVITGIDESNNPGSVAIADPWFAAIHSVSEQNLEDAWDPSLHHIIDVGLDEDNDPTSPTNQ